MPSRQARSLPSIFLMTDERMGNGLWMALERLPRGAGVVFRHYGLPLGERRLLFARVRSVARRRRLVLLLAGSERLALAWRADGVHGPSPHRMAVRPLLRTAPAHDRMQWLAAVRAGRQLVFVSPIHATRSHRDAKPLGRVRAGLMLGEQRDMAVALGGMTQARARSLGSLGITRWAAIDAWLEKR
jgi:thiamine-phosphate pyrophosphorylase